MAKLVVTAYARQGRDDRGVQPVGEEPNLGTFVVDTTVNAGVSAANIPAGTKLLRLHASDAAIAFKVTPETGAAAPAAGAAPILPSGAVEYFGVDEAIVKKGGRVTAAAA